MECLENMKTVYPDENNVVLDENSVERKPFINREIDSDDLTIYLYSFHYINMKFLVVVTPPSIYHVDLYLSVINSLCSSFVAKLPSFLLGIYALVSRIRII